LLQIFQEQTEYARAVGDVDVVAENLPQFETIASGLYKHRNKKFPTLPKLVSELNIDGDYKLTEVGKRTQAKVKNGSNDEHVLMFCSDVGLKVLAESKRWHADSTFDTAVQFEKDKFQQFYLIHGMYKGHLLPCAFALLTNKTIPTNRCLISELKDGAAKIKLILNPKIVMIDFEQAVINAFLYHFPSITIKLCFFHCGQNLFKKIVEIGLKRQ
jgi:hypothetical protein